MHRLGLSLLPLGSSSGRSVVNVDLAFTCTEPDLEHPGPDGIADADGGADAEHKA